MSLKIDLDKIRKVLLDDGKWYDVHTFVLLDAYEFYDDAGGEYSFLGGKEKLIPATGFKFEYLSPFETEESGAELVSICGPITSIKAVMSTYES